MTQDRRITDKLPNEELVFTDRNLIAAGLAHLEAEKAAACLVHAKDDVWVGVGTKDALRGLLREDTAPQSQAVPSELASLPIHTSTDICGIEWMAEEKFVKLSDVQSLFSHSAATGKAEAVAAMNRAKALKAWDCIPHALHVELDTIFKYLASPAAPLAGKAEPVAWAVVSPKGGIHKLAIKRDSAERKLAAWLEEWPNNTPSIRPLVYGDAPLAAAVPAEEARDEYSVIVQLPDIHTKLIEAYTAGAMRSGGDGIDAGAYKCAEKIMRAWDLPDAPAAPAPIQASAEKVQGKTASQWYVSWAETSEALKAARGCIKRYEKLTEDLRKEAARLSKPTAQGTAQSIDTQEFRELMCHLGYWVDEDDAWNDECGAALVEFINRHIAAQAPAGRDAQQWISVDERLPEPRQIVLVKSQSWEFPAVLKYQVQPYQRFIDEVTGRWYWYPERMHWMPLPAAPTAEGEPK